MTAPAMRAMAAMPPLARRIVTGVVVAAVGLAAVFYPWTFVGLLIVIGLSALYELNALCQIKGQPLEYPVAVFGTVAYIVLASLSLTRKWEGVLLAAIVIATFWIGTYGSQKGYFARTAYTLLAVLYIGKLLSYFVFIRFVPGLGMWLTFYVIILIACTDIFAMLIGTSIGRHQLTRISPKKTVEGSLGAVVIVAAIAYAGTFVPQLHLQWWQGCALGIGTCIAAQAGDLVESALKRDAGVKDAGSMIQGHGGVLDRFDSYLFGGMAFYGLLNIIGVLAY